MQVFWEHGYEPTSTDMLTEAMGIGRQSLYDTFGDKRKLYLEALSLYSAQSVSQLIAQFRAEASSLQALRALLSSPARLPPDRRKLGCMGVNAIGEFGQSADDVLQAMGHSGSVLDLVLENLVREGISAGEISTGIKPESAVRFLLSVRSGLMIAARGGATPEHLQEAAEVALNALRANVSG
ncbi:TetR/AcrR family transcriptional regulator [Paraburkholderia caffeinilytica]|uniref:TetR/AcrR family transcriptional regulator n=1 Tax=Paraburkholderia caffeinilytica TaxID=1761016 RepID=UPI0038B9F6AA